MLVLDGVGPAPPGKTYELWIMPGGNVDEAARAGLFPGARRGGGLGVDGTVESGDVVGVTVESAGGVDAADERRRSSLPSQPEPFLCGRNRAAKLESTPLRVRKEKAVPRRRRRVRKRRLAALLLVLFVAAALSFTFGLVRAVASEIPTLDPSAQHSEVDSVVYASNGKSVLAVLRGDESRVLVGTDDIAPIMRQAIVSVEDQRFFEHNGVDVRGIARALWQDVRQQGHRRGRLDDHAAVRQERVHPQRADVRAEGPRGGARLAARAALEQGPDPHRVPEHHLLRPRRLRDPAGGARVLQEERRRPHAATRLRCSPGIPADPSLYDPATNPARRQAAPASRARADARAGEDHAPSLMRANSAPLPAADDIRLPGTRGPAPYFVNYVKDQLVEQYGAGRVFGGGLQRHDDDRPRAPAEGARRDRAGAAQPGRPGGGARRDRSEDGRREGDVRRPELPREPVQPRGAGQAAARLGVQADRARDGDATRASRRSRSSSRRRSRSTRATGSGR